MAESYMKTLIEELSKVLSPDNVFGQPIEHEDKMKILRTNQENSQKTL